MAKVLPTPAWASDDARWRRCGPDKQLKSRDETKYAKMSTERRAFSIELRAKGRRLQGYAAVFHTEARIGDFTETIVPGAFSVTLASGKDVLALVDHDSSKLLARRKSGTLRLSQDARGLEFSIDVPSTSLGNDVLALAERSDLGGMSFAFIPIDEHWDGDHRELRSVDLKEISVVQSWPAYERTTVTARSRPLLVPQVAVRRRYLESL